MASVAKPEAPRSSNGLADSYVGCLISLTSKSEIRYEGLFNDINGEDSTIGLTNVRSFGTEGRKQDGPQVGPSDKVYEYILFRGSDIKALKVLSSAPVQATSTTPVFNDPAIILTHYPQAANISASSQPSSSGSISDLSAHNSQSEYARTTFQSNLPLYQPVGNYGPWAPSSSLPTTNGSSVAPTYFPGYYGPSDGFQPQQQSLLTPPLSLSMPSPIQQPQPYTLITPLSMSSPGQQTSQRSTMNTPLSMGPSGIAALDLSQSPSSLLLVPNFQLSVFPTQSSPLSPGSTNLESPMQQTTHHSTSNIPLTAGASSMGASDLNISPSALLPIPNFQSSVLPAQSSSLNQGTYNFAGASSMGASGLNISPSALLPIPNFQSAVLPAQSASLNQGAYNFAGASSMKASRLDISPSALLPIPNFQSAVLPVQSSSLNQGTYNLQSPMLSSQPPPIVSESSTNLVPSPTQSSLSMTSLNKPAIQRQISNKPVTVPSHDMPVKTSEPSSNAGVSSSVMNEGTLPNLITPGKLLQVGSSSASLSQSPWSTSQKESESAQVSLLPLQQVSQPPEQSSGLVSSNVAPESQGPLLPLPSLAEYKPHATDRRPHPRRNNRGGSQRGRGKMTSRPVTRFTEDFDFIAMNEKFNKDEVWGDIGKSIKAQEDGNVSQEDDDDDGVGSSKPESNPAYVKDDFFDSLSCNSLNRVSQNGRPNFSQQRKKDTETFGFVPRHNRGGRGGNGQGRGGNRQGRGGYGHGRGGGHHGRGGNGHVENGRGHNFPGGGS